MTETMVSPRRLVEKTAHADLLRAIASPSAYSSGNPLERERPARLRVRPRATDAGTMSRSTRTCPRAAALPPVADLRHGPASGLRSFD